MSMSFTIYNGAKIEINAHSTEDRTGPGYFDFIVTEVDGTEVEITVHFDSREGFAFAKQLSHIAKAINTTKELADA